MKRKHIVAVMLGLLACISVLFVVCVFLFKWSIYDLKSTSMHPYLREGSMLVSAKEDFPTIHIGDVLTYKTKDVGTYITHRVIDIDQGNKRLLLKGDNRFDSDGAYIEFDQYQGTLLYHIPFMGHVLSFLQGEWGSSMAFFFILIIGSMLSYEVYIRRVKDE